MTMRHVRSRQGGFSLIEVLVAVLIVSVGVLGVAGLQLLSLQNNTSAMYRTQATQAAYDIMDRARANRGQNYSIAIDANAPSDPGCGTNCSPAAMRALDLIEWREQLAEILPEGTGSVAMNAGSMTVTVRWRDTRNPDAAPLELTVSSQVAF